MQFHSSWGRFWRRKEPLKWMPSKCCCFNDCIWVCNYGTSARKWVFYLEIQPNETQEKRSSFPFRKKIRENNFKPVNPLLLIICYSGRKEKEYFLMQAGFVHTIKCCPMVFSKCMYLFIAFLHHPIAKALWALQKLMVETIKYTDIIKLNVKH